ncbi:hypothetical protein L5L55_14730 [Shewanella glacialipiscicola]|uniref:hypothetical protein n=1 Tax=Shewanella glacialipiscicola TaxID=614069 RepID=UPI0021D94C0B|nr:hypothetical protein [Shewanella glacialipiscicola]MCU7994763.1 hypothetical protein [Shewanella glacialipiscicola]MCU8027447.1 hypothetical protein [Shewanella glacialipiscicola]
MNISTGFSHEKCVQSQSASVHKRPLTCLVLSLAVGVSLLSVLSVSTTAVAANRGYSEQSGHRDSHSRGASHYNNRYDNYGNHYDNRYAHAVNHRYYRPYYRPYYPWGLGLGFATGSGWNVGYGVNTSWNNDWGWNSRHAYARNYWNSPYSGIGLSIPMRDDDEPVAISAPVRVTTSMQYSASEGRMVSSMPTSVPANPTTQTVQSYSDNADAVTAGNNAATPRQRVAHSVSSLPSNARVVQQDGRTLYEWQGALYAYDWNSQTYQEQPRK